MQKNLLQFKYRRKDRRRNAISKSTHKKVNLASHNYDMSSGLRKVKIGRVIYKMEFASHS